MGERMAEVRRLWRLLGPVAVLAVLATAVLAGLTRPTLDAARTAERYPASYAAPAVEPPTYAEPAAGALLAPYDARRTVASRGDLAYTWSVQNAALTTTDIPSAALAAYQRAADVIDRADPSCRLDWETLAAIGKVASDHGRVGGSVLNANAVVHPKVLGPKLTGRNGTARVEDTDGGLVDGEERVDRAVGPMLLLPSTWSVVRVDGDSDGRRNPQDLDDAALGVAVFLCAGPGDLGKDERLRAAVQRYHSGHEWLRAVLRVRHDYWVAARQPADTTVMAREQLPATDPGAEATAGVTLAPDETYDGGTTFDAAPPAPSPSVKPSPSATPKPTPSATPTPSTSASPTAEPSGNPSGEPSATPTPTADPSCEPTATATPTASDEPTPTDEPTATASPTDEPTPGGCPDGPAQPAHAAGDGPAATSAASGAAVVVLPVAGLVWWRRRRSL
jgi:membrane-bound lytic murein transglycosylase B